MKMTDGNDSQVCKAWFKIIAGQEASDIELETLCSAALETAKKIWKPVKPGIPEIKDKLLEVMCSVDNIHKFTDVKRFESTSLDRSVWPAIVKKVLPESNPKQIKDIVHYLVTTSRGRLRDLIFKLVQAHQRHCPPEKCPNSKHAWLAWLVS